MKAEKAQGLTLIELMASMTIFAMLGLFLFTLVQDSLGIYRKSRASGEIYDKFDQISEVVSDDFACVAIGDPEGPGVKLEFLLSHDRKYVAPKGVTLSTAATRAKSHSPGDPRSLLLRFVRTYPGGELNDTIGRFAGTYPGGEKTIDGEADLVESRHARILNRQERDEAAPSRDGDEQIAGLKPPGNLMEVMYFCESGPNDTVGTFTLYRAFHSPVGGRGSFFDDATLLAMTPDWIAAHAKPVVSGLIYLGVVLWGQQTEQWQMESVLDGDGLGRRASNGLSELWWDSRRARYEEFSLHVGDSSAQVYEDDVFPSRIRFLMTFVQDGRISSDAHLVGSVKANTRFVTIDNGKLFEESGGPVPTHLQIDDEWMKVTSATGRKLTVIRGARKTAPAKHDSGSDVRVGRTFHQTVEIPAYRTSLDTGGQVR